MKKAVVFIFVLLLIVVFGCIIVVSEYPMITSKGQTKKSESAYIDSDIEKKIKIIKFEESSLNGIYKETVTGNRTNLKLLSISTNEIIDDDKWLSQYAQGIKKCMTYTFTPGGNRATEEIKNIIPVSVHGLYRRYIDMMDGYNVIYYGDMKKTSDSFVYGVNPLLVVITTPSFNEIMYAIDFSDISVPQRADEHTDISVSEVQIENNVLYACLSHPTYSEYSKGYNAYLVAIDLKTCNLKWITKPLTCNSTFCIYKNVIFTGYGFTNENDYIYVVDKESGDCISSIRLEKAPEYFSVIGDTLYVKTYDRDYSFLIVE